MSLAFADVAAAMGSGPVGISNAPLVPGFSIGFDASPAITPGQGAMLRSWAATATNFTGATMTPAQIGRLVQVWAYNLGVTMPQIAVYCAANM